MNPTAEMLTLARVKQAIAEEPELDDALPPGMLDALKQAMARGDVDFFVHALRTTVRLTKKGIAERVDALANAPQSPREHKAHQALAMLSEGDPNRDLDIAQLEASNEFNFNVCQYVVNHLLEHYMDQFDVVHEEAENDTGEAAARNITDCIDRIAGKLPPLSPNIDL